MAYLDETAGNPGAMGLRIKEFRFVEEGAGAYTAAVTLPADSTVLDIQVYAEAVWDAGTSASLEIGDGDDPDGFYTAVNLKATDLTADQALTFAAQGGVGGAYLTAGSDTHFTNTYSDEARTITATVDSVGAGSAGRTRVLVIYVTSGTVEAATFVAA